MKRKIIILASGLCFSLLSNAQWTGTSPLSTTSKVGIQNAAPTSDLTIGTSNLDGTTTNTSKLLIQEDNPWIELRDQSGYSMGALGNNGAQVGLKMQIPSATGELSTYFNAVAGGMTSLKNSSTGNGFHITGNSIWVGPFGGVSSNVLTLGLVSSFKNTTNFETDNNQFRKLQTGTGNLVPSTVVFSANGSGVFSGDLQIGGYTKVTNISSNDYGYAFNVEVNRDVTKAITVRNSVSNTDNFIVWGNGVVNTKKIYAEGLTVTSTAIGTSWPDFVFDRSYTLKSLEEVESFVNKNKHLPEVPSAKEISENGINTAEMDATLLKKIEELTLYLIDINKTVNELKEENALLKGRIK